MLWAVERWSRYVLLGLGELTQDDRLFSPDCSRISSTLPCSAF
jgi:hypothetical protein